MARMVKVELRCPICGAATTGIRKKLRWRLRLPTVCTGCGQQLPRGGDLIVAAVLTPLMFAVGLVFLFFGLIGAMVALVCAIAVGETVALAFAQPPAR
jgi:hypothetical protein